MISSSTGAMYMRDISTDSETNQMKSKDKKIVEKKYVSRVNGKHTHIQNTFSIK